MRVLYSERANELELSGTGSEMRVLATLLRSVRGSLPLDVSGDPWPYERALSCIESERTSGHVVISHSPDETALWMRGGAQELETFASMLDDFGKEGDAGSHIHIEPRPDHEFFAPTTEPLIISLVS
ncbi:Imm32 family immunity protein [Micromonospora lupini]|uniref:Imm32 family immunity protein n=1 Tax=Micromonospora lupini TaxID=285679 RepID=UPI0031D89027